MANFLKQASLVCHKTTYENIFCARIWSAQKVLTKSIAHFPFTEKESSVSLGFLNSFNKSRNL